MNVNETVINDALDMIIRINDDVKCSDTLSSEAENLKAAIEDGKVCVPIIGMFSSGKTALVNSVLGLGKKLLKENITPETSFPAEITYSDEERFIVRENKNETQIAEEDFRDLDPEVRRVDSVRLELDNSNLRDFPNIMLVDMPGFQSGSSAHNDAIYGYIGRSMAYILVFAADSMTLTASLRDILSDLSKEDKPIYAVITKCDKVDDDTFETTSGKLKTDLKKYTGRDIEFIKTSSVDGETDDFLAHLRKLQSDSADILKSVYAPRAAELAQRLENNLCALRDGLDLSENDLREKREDAEKRRINLIEKFKKIKKSAEEDKNKALESFKNDLRATLIDRADDIAHMAARQRDPNNYINNRINNISKDCLNKHLEEIAPMIEKYMLSIDSAFTSEGFSSAKSFFGGFEFTILGLLLLPLSALAGLAAAVIGLLIGISREKKEAKIKEKLHNEIIPKAVKECTDALEKELNQKYDEIDQKAKSEFKKQCAEIDNNIKKLGEDIAKADADKKAKRDKLENYIKEIEEIKNGL